MGELQYCLDIQVKRDRHKGLIYLCQTKYINDILVWFNITNCKPVSIPYQLGTHLSIDMCPHNDSKRA